MIVTVVAWISLILGFLNFIIGPRIVGEPREPYHGTSSWLTAWLQAFLLIVLSGRVLGWW